MILSIADQHTRIGRRAWLTLGLVAVSLVCFLAPRALRAIGSGAAQVELEQACDYWLEHPYLEPDARVLEAAALAAGSHAPERFLAARRSGAASAPRDAAALAQEQSGLAFLTRLALRGSDERPGPSHAFRRFGLDASAPRGHAILTHVFLHSGWIHLGLALLLVAMAGPVLESRLGPALLAALFVSSGLASALAHLLACSGSSAPLIGASGIASGLCGAFLARFGSGPAVLHGYAIYGMRPRAVSFDVGGWILAPVVGVAQLALVLLSLDAEVFAGSSWAANLGGLACGGVFALALRHWRLEDRFASRARESIARGNLDPRIKRSITARERGRNDEAIEFAAEVLRERPDDVSALQADWDARVAANRAAEGARSARRLVELHARHGELASAARIWDELVRAGQRGPVGATTLLRIVPELVVQARRDAAIAALRAASSAETPALTVGQALRVAELAAELDPPTALRAAKRALADDELVEERRARLEQLVLSLENTGARAAAVPQSPPPAPPAPPAPPDEPFELEPTQLGVGPQADLEPAAPIEDSATVVFVAPAAIASSSARIKITPALPVALDVLGLRVRFEGGAPSLVEWTSIQAVGVGLVAGLGPKPVVVIDLALNWADAPEGAIEVMRLRSDAFRARELVSGSANAPEALRALLAELLARSGAVPLPDPASAHGLPFRDYDSPGAYEEAVLLAES